MRDVILALAALASVPKRGQIPALFRGQAISPVLLAEAVNYYVSIGERDAVKALLALVPAYSRNSEHEEFVRVRIGWICRILYHPRAWTPLRQPWYGALHLPVLPEKNWPLSPIVCSGSSYFVLAQDYTIIGLPESAQGYLDYCRSEGYFRKEPIPVPHRIQARNDAVRLRESRIWKSILWKRNDKEGSNLTWENEVWNFISRQAEAVPPK